MPRGGPPILTDVRGPILVIPCEACERRGRYNVERLMAQHGDAKLTDLFLRQCHGKGGLAAITTGVGPLRHGLRSFPRPLL
jgi:hypothetical protein